jgi:hypothetical protein
MVTFGSDYVISVPTAAFGPVTAVGTWSYPCPRVVDRTSLRESNPVVAVSLLPADMTGCTVIINCPGGVVVLCERPPGRLPHQPVAGRLIYISRMPAGILIWPAVLFRDRQVLQTDSRVSCIARVRSLPQVNITRYLSISQTERTGQFMESENGKSDSLPSISSHR